jgi:hypothetical protein
MGSSTNWHDQLSGATAVLFPSTTALAVTIKAIMAPDGKKIIIVIIRTCVLGPRGLHCPVGKLSAEWTSVPFLGTHFIFDPFSYFRDLLFIILLSYLGLNDGSSVSFAFPFSLHFLEFNSALTHPMYPLSIPPRVSCFKRSRLELLHPCRPRSNFPRSLQRRDLPHSSPYISIATTTAA